MFCPHLLLFPSVSPLQWFLIPLSSPPLGYLDVYAPKIASGRAEFWTQIVDALPAVERWCVGGDFNMLEDPEDRQRGNLVTNYNSDYAFL